MAKSLCNVVSAEDVGMRLGAYCAAVGAYKSRSAADKAISEGKVLVNGQPKKKNYTVQAGDAVVSEQDEETSHCQIIGEPIELDVVYEDDDLLVISKQADLICHPSNEHSEGTLVNALVYRYGPDGLCNVQGEDDRPGIVHRLDGDTSGLMICAKTDEAGQALMDSIASREVDRKYLALVHGVISVDTGLIDVPIQRNPADRLTMAAGDGPSARDAITSFKVLERFMPGAHDNGYTLVECKLYTGRTHQIRVHMQYIDHPVVGDQTYNSGGPKTTQAQRGLCRQFLHSYKLAFEHPTTGKTLEFEDSLAPDLQEVLDELRDEAARGER